MNRLIVANAFCLVALLLGGCVAASQPEPTVYPTYTPYPQPTPYPTYTPFPEPTAYPTYTPYPVPTAYPTYTPYPEPTPPTPDLTYLFCEYEFCIGRPSAAYLTDMDAPESWNEYHNGVLVGINASGVFMAVDWKRTSRSGWNLEEEALDAANELGQAQDDLMIEQIGPFEMALVSSIGGDNLPYGFVAAWYCGDRGFRAAVFDKNQTLPEQLLRDAVALFVCN